MGRKSKHGDKELLEMDADLASAQKRIPVLGESRAMAILLVLAGLPPKGRKPRAGEDHRAELDALCFFPVLSGTGKASPYGVKAVRWL